MINLGHRPTYPNVKRQLFAPLAVIGSLLAMEAGAAVWGPHKLQGLVLLLVVIFGTYWSGLRAGIISCGILLGYVVLAYNSDLSYFDIKPENFSRALYSTAVTFPLIALITGVVTGKLRNSRIREYDAREAAQAETQQRLAAEHVLKASEEMSRLIVESSMDVIVVLDAGGRITLWNPVAERTFGWLAPEAEGREIFDLIIPAVDLGSQTPIQFLHLLREARNSERRIEIIARNQEGRQFPIELDLIPHNTETGMVYVLFARDISVRKRSENILIDANDELERRVEERTAAMAEMFAELESAKIIAETANTAKSEFLSRMSHELRTPLNAILGFAQLLGMQVEDPKQRDGVQQILKGGRHLLQVINEILDLSRIESGRISISLEPFALAPLVDEAIRLVLPLAKDRAIEINVSEIPTDLIVSADRQRFTQVVLNLLSNAVKYNREYGSISVRCVQDGDERVRLEISDTGPGIERPDRLFRPFERLGETKVEGTGLGLALSRGFAEAMGGTLEIRETSSKGSTFALTLQASEAISLESAALPIRSFSRSVRGEKKKQVLYIEDNAANIHLIQRVIENLPSIQLMVAMQGRLGMNLAEMHKPDLILLDLNLPDLHGKEVLRELKGNLATADIPVVVISADAQEKMEKAVRELGAFAFLAKPLDIGELIGVLNTLLWDEELVKAA